MSTPEAVVNVGADLLADAVADQADPGHPGRLAPADGRHRGRPRDGGRRPAAGARPTSARSPRCSTSPPPWSTSRRPRRCSGCSAASSCTPARRSPGTRASGPLRGALMAGAALEGLVDDPEDAVALFESGTGVSLEPCHHRSDGRPDGRRRHAEHVDVRARGRRPPAGVPTARSTRASARCCGTAPTAPRCSPGCAGCATCSGRCCRRAVARSGPDPVDVTGILTQMLQMGDEAHNRNRAGTLMLLRDLSPAMVTSGRRRRGRRGVAALHRRQRPLLPQPRDAGVQARARRRPRHRGLDDGRRDGPQRHRLRHPGRRHRRRVVHRSGPARRRPLPRQLRPRRRQPRHRRLRDHRDRRHRRLRDGDRAGDRPARRRLRAGRPGHHPADARDHPRREPALDGARSWSSRARRPASTSPGCAAPGSCRRSTPAWPARSPGSARSAPAWSRRPPRSSRRRWPGSPAPGAGSRAPGLSADGSAGGRHSAASMSTLPEGRSGVPSSR